MQPVELSTSLGMALYVERLPTSYLQPLRSAPRVACKAFVEQHQHRCPTRYKQVQETHIDTAPLDMIQEEHVDQVKLPFGSIARQHRRFSLRSKRGGVGYMQVMLSTPVLVEASHWSTAIDQLAGLMGQLTQSGLPWASPAKLWVA